MRFRLGIDTGGTYTDEVLVDVRATALNRADLLQRMGFYPGPPMAHEIPGMEYGTLLKSPDFETLARGYGMAAFAVRATAEFPAALAGAIAEPGPALIHLHLDKRDVSPYQ